MMVAEIRMLHWMCGQMKLDRIRNVVIRDKVRVISMEDKSREARLRWFGHIRRSMNAQMRRCERIVALEGKRGRGTPRKIWKKVIR